MAETLGSLCDKLTIVKLKQFHADDESKLRSLNDQERLLVDEINEFFGDAVMGNISLSKLTFASNKIYKERGNEIKDIAGSLGEVCAELAKINCDLWHEQEKVYDFERIPTDRKDEVVKMLAILNLKRNKCIDRINVILSEACRKQKSC